VVEEYLRLIVASSAYGAIDDVRRGMLAEQVAELVGISQAQVSDQMRRLGRRIRRPAAEAAEATGPESSLPSEDTAERWLLAALIDAPELFCEIEDRVGPEHFSDPRMRAVAEAVWKLGGQDRLDLPSLLAAEDTAQWGRIITDLQAGGQRRGHHHRHLEDAADVLLARQQRRRLELEVGRRGQYSPEDLREIAARAAQADKRRRPRLGSS
jgi:hypothetical protein